MVGLHIRFKIGGIDRQYLSTRDKGRFFDALYKLFGVVFQVGRHKPLFRRISFAGSL